MYCYVFSSLEESVPRLSHDFRVICQKGKFKEENCDSCARLAYKKVLRLTEEDNDISKHI